MKRPYKHINNSQDRPVKRLKVDTINFYGDRFIFDCITGSFHRISGTAAFVIRELQKNNSLLDIIHHFSKRYGISTKKAVTDVEILISELIALSLVKAEL